LGLTNATARPGSALRHNQAGLRRLSSFFMPMSVGHVRPDYKPVGPYLYVSPRLGERPLLPPSVRVRETSGATGCPEEPWRDDDARHGRCAPMLADNAV
jgi:hypothetical protein